MQRSGTIGPFPGAFGTDATEITPISRLGRTLIRLSLIFFSYFLHVPARQWRNVAIRSPPALSRLHVRGQPDPLQGLDDVVIRVQFPPAVLDGGAGGIVMVIVVPALSAGDDRHKPVISAVIV